MPTPIDPVDQTEFGHPAFRAGRFDDRNYDLRWLEEVARAEADLRRAMRSMRSFEVTEWKALLANSRATAVPRPVATAPTLVTDSSPPPPNVIPLRAPALPQVKPGCKHCDKPLLKGQSHFCGTKCFERYKLDQRLCDMCGKPLVGKPPNTKRCSWDPCGIKAERIRVANVAAEALATPVPEVPAPPPLSAVAPKKAPRRPLTLNAVQIASLLSCSPSVVSRWGSSEALPGTQVGGRRAWRFNAAVVQKLITDALDTPPNGYWRKSDLWTRKEAADELGCSHASVALWTEAGKLKCFRIGEGTSTHTRYSKQAVLQFKADRAVQG